MRANINGNPLTQGRLTAAFGGVLRKLGRVLLIALAAASGALLFFSWLGGEMLEGDSAPRQVRFSIDFEF